ncbi:MAG TPA: gliding motility-associated C-terminal domain-containing protein, partial [Draconibacterium sp.]|nr:gliding motility-associated C-terminal domain-containing protein [Draconibacterium sp.]
NEYGCSITKSTFVNVDIFVPNVFTPNNDGVNDLFMPGYNLKIFNRHGIVLYNGQDGWDGYYKGRALDPDTYFYVLNYIDANQKNRVKTGYVTLER